MKLSACIESYVNYRRSLGVCFHGEQVRLRTFGGVMGDIEVARVTQAAVRRYLDGKGPVTSFWLSKYHTLTGLFRFAISRGHIVNSPLPVTKPRPTATFVPYIYSLDDMRALLRATDERHEEDWLVRPSTVRTLLLLLYGTGLRISEALALNLNEVDLADRILTVRQTKFYKSRLVPFGEDVHGLLHRYHQLHHRRGTHAGDRPFLMDRNERRILRQTAELVFYRIRDYAGLRRAPGFKFRPRLHDLRHTFAVNRLVSWYQEGQNVQRLLPHLSTYLGHRSVKETQPYLNLTSDVAHEAGLRFLSYALPREHHV
jgi:integrase/recombinase XerD